MLTPEPPLSPQEEALKRQLEPLLDEFSKVLLAKLLANERKHGFGSSWMVPDWEPQLHKELTHHVEKGDPRDTAIYSFFAWYHGWTTSPLATKTSVQISPPCFSDEQLINEDFVQYRPGWWTRGNVSLSFLPNGFARVALWKGRQIIAAGDAQTLDQLHNLMETI